MTEYHEGVGDSCPVALGLDAKIDDALGLKMVSIRLPSQLIEDFKLLAGKGAYQTLIRKTLTDYARDELLRAGRAYLITNGDKP